MKNLYLLLAVSVLTGCTTIATISKMNRVLPQMDNLVYLQDQENRKPSLNGSRLDLCGADVSERDRLVAVAHLMGWKTFDDLGTLSPEARAAFASQDKNCTTVYYHK